jgi:hypothetical protein
MFQLIASLIDISASFPKEKLLRGLIPRPFGSTVSQETWAFLNHIFTAILMSSGLFSAPGMLFMALPSHAAAAKLSRSPNW